MKDPADRRDLFAKLPIEKGEGEENGTFSEKNYAVYTEK